MSRSIHTTRRSVREALADDYRDRAQKRRRVDALRGRLGKKRGINQHVVQSRQPFDARSVGDVGLRAVGLMRRDRLDEALAAAERGIADFEGLGGSHIFVAVRLDIMARRGIRVDASALRDVHFEGMRRAGYGPWVNRLAGLMEQ